MRYLQDFDHGQYVFRKCDQRRLSTADMVAFYADWVRQFPIWSIEDGLAENDWSGWKLLAAQLGGSVQLVGDDVFVTNPTIIRRAVKVANAALITLNRIGTVSETLAAIDAAGAGGYGVVISHRSAETPDDFLADFAVATAAGWINTGAPCRGERTAKYNQLLRIEGELGSEARHAGTTPFRRSS